MEMRVLFGVGTREQLVALLSKKVDSFSTRMRQTLAGDCCARTRKEIRLVETLTMAERSFKQANENWRKYMAENEHAMVAWDRDAVHQINAAPMYLAPRMYLNCGIKVFVGYFGENKQGICYDWIPNPSDELGGKWRANV